MPSNMYKTQPSLSTYLGARLYWFTKQTLWRNQYGSAALELGLTLPVLLVLACGVMDFGRVFYAGIAVESAARAGVQVGSFSLGKAGSFSAMNTAGENDAAGQGMTGLSVSSRTFCGCAGSTGEVSCS